MATAGSVTIEILASTGSFDTSIDRSTKAAEKRLREFQRTAETAGAAIGLAMTAAGVAAVAFGKNVIDGLDALNDVADATGASIENLSAFEDIAARTGTRFDNVTAALIKFNDVLKDAAPGTKQAAIIDKLGLSVDALRKMDPAEAMFTVAKALSQWAADGDRARAVQELFGKQVREGAAFIKDLGEQGKLTATVLTQQAAQAEAFNRELFAMEKNVKDLGRSIAVDLLPKLNEWATVIREGGWKSFLSLGGDQTDDPGAAILDVTKRLNEFKKAAADFENAHPLAKLWSVEDQAARKESIAGLEAQLKGLKALQAARALAGAGDTSDALSRRLGDRPGFGPIPDKGPKAKAKDADADFKSYLSNLEQQLQKLDELTVSEKLLDDLRRGSLTVSNEAQFNRLWGLAQEADAMKTLRKEQEESDKRLTESNRQVQKLAEDRAAAGKAVYEQTRTPLEALNAEFVRLNDLLREGAINWDTHGRAVLAAQDQYEGLTKKITENSPVMEDFAHLAGDAMHDLISGGQSASQVFANLLKRIADLVLELGVIAPLMDQIRVAMGGQPKGGGFDFGKLLLGAVGGALGGSFSMGAGDALGMSIGGTYGPSTQAGLDNLIGSLAGRADGGPVSAGQPYLVGERGPEMFVPRTAGMVTPNNALGAGGWNTTVINQTTGRADKVSEKQLSPRERVVVLQENQRATAAALANPNSEISQALKQYFNVRQQRS